MSDASQRIYKLTEELRAEWADIMLYALKQNGHVYLSEDAYYKLKGELMQILVGKVPV